MKLTKKSSQAFTNLRANPEFEAVLEWLAEYRNSAREECCKLPPEKVLRAQGKVEAITTILDAVVQAPATLEKFKLQR